MYYKKFKNFRRWRGYHIYAVDGSTIQIPESEENIRVFGCNPNQSNKLRPLASVSALYDIMNDMLIDVTLKPYCHNERAVAMEHMEYLPFSNNVIILFDRGYPSEKLFRFLDARGIKFLMRLPKSFKRLISEQPDILYTYPKNDKKATLTLRCLHFNLENGETEYLITNLMENQLEYSDFFELYKLRWGIESKYRELKNRLEIEDFNSIKPVSIQQEFFAAILFSNLASIIKQDADSLVDSASHTANKHAYQANRSYILNRIKSHILTLVNVADDLRMHLIESLVDEASKVISIIRTGRTFGRYRNNDRRKYYVNMKSCI